MQSLVFFNKEGDSLNFKWRPGEERWEGNLIFHENSNDTFKTIGIYLFERIRGFEFEVPGIMKLEKFQLFNEFRFTITGNSYLNEPITRIEAVNNDVNFYSKWVYGRDFEKKYPVGCQIIFDQPIFEFTNINISYTVIKTKKNAILIITSADNRTFTNLYGGFTGLTNSYTNKTISGLNSIGVYNYIDPRLNETISPWSEPDFYMKYFNRRKLNLINTEKNNGTWTINNPNIQDKSYTRFQLSANQFTQNQNLAIEVILRTDLPVVYSGNLNIIGDKIEFSNSIPLVFKPNVEFILPQSTLNRFAMKVSPIVNFLVNSNLIYYATQSQVIFNNKIYECIQAYTWSATFSTTPDDTDYWSEPTYIRVDRQLVNETLNNTEIHLTTNKIFYNTAFTQSALTTIGTTVEKYSQEFRFFDIDLYVKNSTLFADLIYPSPYAEINYYLFTQSSVSSFQGFTNSATRTNILENTVGIEEILKNEINKDFCENFNYNIVFTDLDDYGLKVRINGQEYEEQIDFIYVGLQVDLERTIDRTLRNWLSRHYVRLLSLGIFATLRFIGGGNSFYYNTINLRTEYPNVPLQFEVKVGITADYYIQHSEIVFYQMSNYLQITINGRNYGQAVSVTGNGVASILQISQALSNWIDKYREELVDWGIWIDQVNNMLSLKVKRQNQRVDVIVSVGKSSLPGAEFYRINRKMRGNFGALITSNAVTLPNTSTYSFELQPFATGQIVGINNSNYPLNNQEYNIIYLGPEHLILSYQGPFWGNTDPYCMVSPYTSIAFSTGFGATGCTPVIVPTASVGGNFNLQQFTYSFSLTNLSLNTYQFFNYNLINNTNIVDIIYLQISGSLYILGDKVSVVDAFSTGLITTIDLIGVTPGTSKSFTFNPYNNYLYCLTTGFIFIIDPVINSVVSVINLTFNPHSLIVSEDNGDIWISYSNAIRVEVWTYNNLTNTPSRVINLTGFTRGMIWNESENDVYVSQNNDRLVRIDASTKTVVATYSIFGLNEEIFYEPVNSSVYYFDVNGLGNLNNGTIQFVSSGTSSFKDIVYNPASGKVVISQTSTVKQITTGNTLENNYTTTEYGKLAVSYYDGDTYLPSQNAPIVLILDGRFSNIARNQTVNSIVKKLVFNPERNSMFGIQPGTGTLIEIAVTLASSYQQLGPTFSTGYNNQLGSLDPNYVARPDLWLNTREYLRKPRENYNDEPFVKYIWKWETDEFPQMFLFDFSGNQLPISGSYAYTGEKPLNIISLNKNPNRELSRTSLPEFQQTVFSEIITTLEHVDSEEDLSIVPEPLETFIGFRSDDEGVLKSTLLLVKREEISMFIEPNQNNYDWLTFTFVRNGANSYGVIKMNVLSMTQFTVDSSGKSRGFKVGQLIRLTLNDITNINGKYLSSNNGKVFKIRRISSKEIIVDFVDTIVNDTNVVENYPRLGVTTFLNVTISVVDKTIGRFEISGQTEIEDIRYKIELSNVGQNVYPEDIYIFKPYDINEQGVDWTYLNRKRKEMLLVRHDIFPYVGSYKAIINAINFFGYNDLELYEYYRNINSDSPDFNKLFKVEIPDIFDNTIKGWNSSDFIRHTIPNNNFSPTNFFNLTFKITDKEGNNVLQYSLAEVIIKLQGLKLWLKRNIIPLTHKILDITGRADWVNPNSIIHRNYDAKILNIRQSMTPMDFSLVEAYLMPVNSGSTVYNCVVNFFIVNQGVMPDYFTVNIRTYKTYKEWNPFETYTTSDKVIYYGKIYQSTLVRNRLKNPRKYENAPKWNTSTNYFLGQFVKYDNYIYQWIGTQSSFQYYGTGSNNVFNLGSNTETPFGDIKKNGAFAKWVDNTEWREVEIEPVQTIKQYRTTMEPFNFAIDSNIDPFIVIEVTSDNGYGQIYTRRKNYEIRGLNDLYKGYQGDPIEPFSPIVQLSGNPPLAPNLLPINPNAQNTPLVPNIPGSSSL